MTVMLLSVLNAFTYTKPNIITFLGLKVGSSNIRRVENEHPKKKAQHDVHAALHQPGGKLCRYAFARANENPNVFVNGNLATKSCRWINQWSFEVSFPECGPNEEPYGFKRRKGWNTSTSVTRNHHPNGGHQQPLKRSCIQPQKDHSNEPGLQQFCWDDMRRYCGRKWNCGTAITPRKTLQR